MKESKLPKFRIKRTPYSAGGFIGYDYKIVFDGERKEGTAQMFFYPIEQSPLRGEQIAYLYRNFQVKPSDILAELNKFYPNGEDNLEEFMREGVGSFVLERLIRDSLIKEARSMLIKTHTPEMIAFSEKKGFHFISGGTRTHIKDYFRVY